MPRTRADLTADRFGVLTETHLDPVAAAVDVVPTLLLGLNPNRLAFLIVNLSAGAIYVKPANNPSVASGIVLDANGGDVSAIWDEDFDAVGLEWYAIAGVAGSAVMVLEVVAV